jgi:hypothetical protein
MRIQAIAVVIAALVLCACGRSETAAAAAVATAASQAANARAKTTVGGVTLETSTVALANLGQAVAGRYGIDTRNEGVLLLVTVRDANGDAIDAGDLRLEATSAVLPEAPKPLPLRMIQTAGMTDYIGVVETRAPASIQFRLTATRGGARAEVATTAELLPR